MHDNGIGLGDHDELIQFLLFLIEPKTFGLLSLARFFFLSVDRQLRLTQFAKVALYRPLDF